MNIFSRLKQKFKKKQPIKYVDSDQFVKENIASLLMVAYSGRKSKEEILDSVVNYFDEVYRERLYIQYSFMDKLSKIV